MARHRFRPRYRGVAWTAVGVGGSLAIVAASIGFVALPLVTGAVGIAVGAAYLASPTWRLAVTVDDDGLELLAEQAALLVLLVDQHQHDVLQRRLADCHGPGERMQYADLDRVFRLGRLHHARRNG